MRKGVNVMQKRQNGERIRRGPIQKRSECVQMRSHLV